MTDYIDLNSLENCSKEELLNIISNLNEDNRHLRSIISNNCPNVSDVCKQPVRFKQKYAIQILDSLPDMLSVISNEGMMIDLVSSEHTNHVGEPSEQLFGRSIREFIPEAAYISVIEGINKVVETQQETIGHHTLFDEHNNPHYYENRIFPLDNDNSLCMCRDITETVIAGHELESIRYAVNNASDNIFAANSDGLLVFANKQFLIDHNYENIDSSMYVYTALHSIKTEKEWLRIVDVVRKKGVMEYTTKVTPTDGEIKHFDIMVNIAVDSIGKETFWFFARDITVRIVQQKKIQELNYLMDAILNNIPVYLFVKDVEDDFRYIYWNKAFETYSGIPASKALGCTDFEIFPNVRDANKFRKDDLELLKQGGKIEFVEEYDAVGGESRVVQTSKSLVPNNKQLPFLIGVSWDITDLKNTEKSLIAAKVAAEKSDKLKTAFLANMSHEIRTPLNAIVGFSQLIAETEEEEEKQQYLEIINSNSELLLQLISDILNLSQIEAGTLEFVSKPVNVTELCNTIYEVIKPRVKPGVELVFEGLSDALNIIGDQTRLTQVVTNLLTNACKFTDKGEIKFGFSLEGDRINFFVCDTGIGITEDKVESVFNRFVKLNTFVQGTGLGLSITKMIVERFGGDIAVTSKLGKGTEFRFWIPYHPA